MSGTAQRRLPTNGRSSAQRLLRLALRQELLKHNGGFESKVIAQCISPLLSKPDDKLAFCQVKGKHADSRAEFNSLLWDMIPAFEPVEASKNATQAAR
jgi:hypothetical protein